MDRTDDYPVPAQTAAPAEDYSVPADETEYSPPCQAAEYTPPSGEEYPQPPQEEEFSQFARYSAEPRERGGKRPVRRLFYYLAAVLLIIFLFNAPQRAPWPITPMPSPAPVQTAPPVQTPAPAVEPTTLPSADPTPEPTPEPTTNEPGVKLFFFSFSAVHYGVIEVWHEEALHSVYVDIRDQTLGNSLWSIYIEREDFISGRYELPPLDYADYYLKHLDQFSSDESMPELVMNVTIWYESDSGQGEDTAEYSCTASPEMGFSTNYWEEITIGDQHFTDCFVVSPWEIDGELRYVINDIDALDSPDVISVSLSFGARSITAEDCIVAYEDYTFTGEDRRTGQSVTFTDRMVYLVIPRPDWIPESGTVHVKIVQRLRSSGELWIQERELDYPFVYDS